MLHAAITNVDKKTDTFLQAPGAISMHAVLLRIQQLVTLYALLFLLPKQYFTRVGLLEPGLRRPRVCPRPTICSEGFVEIALLAGARLSAFYMLVPIAAVFLTKARLALAEWNKTILSIILPAFDLHQIHVRAGWQVALSSLFHVACHVARYMKRNMLATMSMKRIGWSGWIAFAMLFPIALLQLSFCRRFFSYELRKPAHVIGALVFAVAGVFHGPLALPIVLCLSCAVYFLDVVYTNFWRTWRVEHSKFVRLGRGTELTFHLPPHWPDHFEGYVNVLVPWISRWQWHAFSAYASIDRPGFASVFALDSGDWTKALHASIARDTRRPVWIQGPIPSPYGERAADFDYMVLVATGIGITPALSCITKFATTGRSLVLIWTCRDPSLVAFYRHRLSETVLTLIFYTGKEPIKVDGLPSHVRVLDKRPDLAVVVPDCMRCVEHNAALPADVRRRAANFLVNMNNTYAGIFECSQGAVRLRFDTFMSASLRRGRTPSELVNHFLRYLCEAHNVQTNSAAGDASEMHARRTTFHEHRDNRTTTSIQDERGNKGDMPSWINYLPFASSVLSHAVKGSGTRSGTPSSSSALENEGDDAAHLDTKIFDANIFGRAFSALATDVVTFSFDDCVELIRTISADGDSMCSINELHAALEHLRVVAVSIDTHQKALRCKMQQQKQLSQGSIFWRHLAAPGRLASSFRDLLLLSSKTNSESVPARSSSLSAPPLNEAKTQKEQQSPSLPSTDAEFKTRWSDEIQNDVTTDIEDPRASDKIPDIVYLATDESGDASFFGEYKADWAGEQITPRGTLLKSSSRPSLQIYEKREEDVDSLRLDVRKDRWGIMYCGGVAQVQAQLRDVAQALGVPFALEQFNW